VRVISSVLAGVKRTVPNRESPGAVVGRATITGRATVDR
jgi:hypothetical protein